MTYLSDTELGGLLGISLPGASGGPELRFVQNVLSWYEKWLHHNRKALKNGNISASATAVLVYAELPRLSSGLPRADNGPGERIFRDAFDPLCDGVIACNENLEDMLRFGPRLPSANSAFQFVQQQLTSHHTFVLIPLSQSRMLIHLHGHEIAAWTAQPNEITVNASTKPTITPDSIAKTMHEFGDQNLKYPTCAVANRVWKGGKPFQLDRQPEALIQAVLVVHLQALYHGSITFVDDEVRTAGGRSDIRIARAAPRGGPHRTVTTMIELKVLSAYKSQQKNLEWAIKGIEQADSYRRPDTDAVFAWLYDARRTKSALGAPLKRQARIKNVRLEETKMLHERPKLAQGAKKRRGLK